MALQIRRGSALDRLTSGLVPAQGEFIYTTDEKNLYIGDGVTPGGLMATGKIGAWEVAGAIDTVYLIQTSSRVGGYAYFETTQDHGLTVGDEITISASPSGNYDGTFTVYAVVNAGEFSIAMSGVDLPLSSTVFAYTVPESPFDEGAVVIWNEIINKFEVRALDKADVGLDQVDNTSDLNKPISTATQAAIDALGVGDLVDVNLGTLNDNDTLIWDDFAQEWVNGAAGGGGSASFPETYYPRPGVGKTPNDETWIGTNTMFQYKSDAHNAYRGVNQLVYRTEQAVWNDFRGAITTTPETTWAGLTKNAGDWAVSGNPQVDPVLSFFTYDPYSKRNASFADWAATMVDPGQHSFGRVFWAGEIWPTGFYMDAAASPNLGQLWLTTDEDLTLAGAAPPISTPTTGSGSLQVTEYNFINGWTGSYSKMAGPVGSDFATPFEATNDSWDEVQWDAFPTARYYPYFSPTGTGGYTIPWTWTFAGTVIQKLVITSTGSIVFLPAATSAFQYDIDSSAENKFITERWTAENQWILALCDEPGVDGAASKVFIRVQGETGSRSLTVRMTKVVAGVFTYRIEFAIHEGANDFQIVCAPIETIDGKSIADTLLDYPLAAEKLTYLGNGIVKGGEYATHLGYACDEVGMALGPNSFTDGEGRVIRPATVDRRWLEPVFDAACDVNKVAGLNSVLIQTDGQYPYRFLSNRIGRDFLSDIGHNNTTLSFNTSSNSITTPNSNGRYYWYRDSGTTTSRLRVYRFDSAVYDLGTSTSGYIKDKNYVADSTISLEIGNVTYSLLLSATPTWTASPGYWEFRFKNTNTDGATLYSQLDEVNIGQARFNLAPTYAPIFRYETLPTTGDIFRWNGSKWLPATIDAVLPTQSGNSGEYLTTNGTTASWDSPLPSQSGNSGKFLTTNGTTASWGTVAVPGDSRITDAITTASIGPGVTANATFTGLTSNGLFARVTPSVPAWVRFYSSTGARSADSARLISEDPTPGSGVLLEIITTVNNETIVITPSAHYFNNDTSQTNAVYAAITNQDISSAAITVTVIAYST